ncbi:hypothetical protein IT407_01730 [Candidatus Uhrbacteria bacterium]|nr:hypothetical protein [Candidatus Uhrbacteria bacterium]
MAGGIWDPDYAVIQSRPPTASAEVDDTESPYDGEEVRGVCWTREGERLARLLRDERTSRMDGDSRLEALVEEEAETREAADRRHEETLARMAGDLAVNSADDYANESRIETLFFHVLCLQSGSEYIARSSIPASHFESVRGDPHVTDRGYECDEARFGSRRRSYTSSGAGTFGFRFSLMPGLGFQPLTAEQTIESPVPFYLMGEFSLTASIGGDWFVDGGLGFGYPFPDYRGRTMLEGMYHLGFMALIENTVAIGFGGTLMERYTDVFQSIHTIGGGYLEANYNLRRGGWQPYIGARIVVGVGIRAGYDAVLDGAAFINLGIAHLDADEGRIDTVFDDCDTPECRDTPIGRVQVP